MTSILKTIPLDIPFFMPLPLHAIGEAQTRLAPYIHRTPLLRCQMLDTWLGHEIIFKAEGLQKVGAFKIRGALNALLTLKEEGKLPQRVVAFSSGNHAQAVARAGKMLGIPTVVVMPRFVSQVKQQATRGYGAELLLTDTRQQAETLALQLQAEGAYFIHPSDDDQVIAGQGTACLEALQDMEAPDAIFATCGGGGLLAGSLLAMQAQAPQTKLFGAEPLMANDATQSYRSGRIVDFVETPMTIADGARTLRVSERCFYYLKQLSDFYEVEERSIIYWTQWLQHLLKVSVEPTSATAMAAAHAWLAVQQTPQRVLVILSGGNVDAATQARLWAEDFLSAPPGL